MFPPYENDFEAIEEQFMSRCGVKPRPHWITTEFGGKNRVSVEEVWKEHYILQWNAGSLEPWRGTEEYFELVTKKGAHHADLRAATKGDPEWLKEQRKQEVAIIEKWISEYYRDLKEEED
ncbi:hypothetical protein Bca4012_044974 [Brassica carinata]